jgi:hypothetical protein
MQAAVLARHSRNGRLSWGKQAMNWIRKSLGFGRGELFDPDETIVNGAPYDGRLAKQDSLIRGSPEAVADDHTAEEIKRRQVSLALRYIMTVRAR